MKHLDRYRGCLLGGAAGDAKNMNFVSHRVRFVPDTGVEAAALEEVQSWSEC